VTYSGILRARFIPVAVAVVSFCMAPERLFAADPCPCDIYAAGGTPCVAAHSMVRALYAAYDGPLYQVKRTADGKTLDIKPLAPGGFADAAAQDSFLAGKAGTVSIIYDQSPKGNHLKSAPGGGAVKTADKEVTANRWKVTVGGHTVYGAYFEGGMGYRNNKTSGVATGDNPESMYMVAGGKHYNNKCCWDYGNAETTNNDDGEGTMECIYFGNCTGWGKGSGSGPWVMADIENGLWAGNVTPNSNNTPLTPEYLSAMVKGKPHTFAIKAGDAATGKLKTMWEGAYPAKGATGRAYDPMRKQGAIILGIGGDNSNGGVGTFFEGAMTTGYSADSTDAAIQANIVDAGYGKSVRATFPVSGNAPAAFPFEVHYNALKAAAVIGFTLRETRRVTLSIVDQHGRRIAGVMSDAFSAGRHVAVWNTGRVPAGVYMVRMKIDGREEWTGKLVVGK
jgi:non-reducing end alpha-L-arabinofuranosidase